jgi:integrase/recombinase XerD
MAHPLIELSEKYLATKVLSQATLKSYRITFKLYTQFLIEKKILFAKTSDVIAYREMMRIKGCSSSYIHIHISALKGLYRYLKHSQEADGLLGHYAHDIMVPVKDERIKHRLDKPILTLEEAKHLILKSKENRHNLWEFRNHAMIYLMITSGLRPIEIVQAKRSDYQIVQEKAILEVSNKGNSSNKDIICLSKGAKEALDDYLDLRHDDVPYLFISHKQLSKDGHLSRMFFIEMFRSVLKASNLSHTKITPNSLRHTAGIINLQRGASILETKQLLRHENIKSTLIYQTYIERLSDQTEHELDRFILKEDLDPWIDL